jgi:hypothetical protein
MTTGFEPEQDQDQDLLMAGDDDTVSDEDGDDAGDD